MYNEITILGNVGRDPEVRSLPSGSNVCNFTVAVNRSVNVNGEWQNETEWFNVSCWNDMADRAAQQLRRGNLIFIKGQLSTREYSKQDGSQGFSLEVRSSYFRNLGTRAQADGQQQGTAPQQGYAAPAAPYNPTAAPQQQPQYAPPPQQPQQPQQPAPQGAPQPQYAPVPAQGEGLSTEDLPW